MNGPSTHPTATAWGCNCQPTPTATTAPSQSNALHQSSALWLKLNAARAVALAMCREIEETNAEKSDFMHGLATASIDAIEATMSAFSDLERCIQAAAKAAHHTTSAEG